MFTFIIKRHNNIWRTVIYQYGFPIHLLERYLVKKWMCVNVFTPGLLSISRVSFVHTRLSFNKKIWDWEKSYMFLAKTTQNRHKPSMVYIYQKGVAYNNVNLLECSILYLLSTCRAGSTSGVGRPSSCPASCPWWRTHRPWYTCSYAGESTRAGKTPEVAKYP